MKKTKFYTKSGRDYRITLDMRWDDECRNGHNTFSMCADINEKHGNRWVEYSGGQCVEEMAKHFPEYEHMLKWHLMSEDGPMSYIANTVYFAGDRDCWGSRKGEVRRTELKLFLNDVPIPVNLPEKVVEWVMKCPPESDYEIIEHVYTGKEKFDPHYTFKGLDEGTWYGCPFRDRQAAEQHRDALLNCKKTFISIPVSWGEGKERELDAARRCAIWPEATDEQLSLPKEELTKLLQDRLPSLMGSFYADLKGVGLL